MHTMRQVAEKTIVCHLKELGKTKKVHKYKPQKFNKLQKLNWCKVSPSLNLRNNKNSFLDQNMVDIEKWILYKIQNRSSQLLENKQNPRHFAKPKLYQPNKMVTVL